MTSSEHEAGRSTACGSRSSARPAKRALATKVLARHRTYLFCPFCWDDRGAPKPSKPPQAQGLLVPNRSIPFHSHLIGVGPGGVAGSWHFHGFKSESGGREAGGPARTSPSQVWLGFRSPSSCFLLPGGLSPVLIVGLQRLEEQQKRAMMGISWSRCSLLLTSRHDAVVV